MKAPPPTPVGKYRVVSVTPFGKPIVPISGGSCEQAESVLRLTVGSKTVLKASIEKVDESVAPDDSANELT